MAKFKPISTKLRTFKPKQRVLPKGRQTFAIVDIAEDGRGIAKVDGKTVFVKGALPGETVIAVYTSVRKTFDEATTQSVVKASDARRTPPCQYYGRCGGCDLQHISYEEQLALKLNKLQRQLAQFCQGDTVDIEAEPIYSQSLAYRHRARFSVSANRDRCLLGFKKSETHQIIAIDSCQLVEPAINALIPALGELVTSLKGRSGVKHLSVVLDANRQLAILLEGAGRLPDADLTRLQAFSLNNQVAIAAAQITPDRSELYWRQTANAASLCYRLEPDDIELEYEIQDFTQVNTAVNQQLVQRAVEWMDLQGDESVVDLFCGIGNFSLPMARRAGKVTGVEFDAEMVARAKGNAERNRLSNVQFIGADLLARPQSIAGQFDKALLDPPRSGAEAACQAMSGWGVKRVVYISCNPNTFFRDAIILGKQGYRLQKLSLADMFPQTAHCELISVFVK